MRKKIGVLLTAAVLAVCLAAAGEAPEQEEPEALSVRTDLVDLYDYGAESMRWLGIGVPVEEGLVLCSTRNMPEDGGYLAISNGEGLWESTAVLKDEKGLTALVMFDEEEAPEGFGGYPFPEQGLELRPDGLSVRTGDRLGSRINRAVLTGSRITWQGLDCLQVTLSGDAELGSPLLTEGGELAGILAAEYAEGRNRYIALSTEGIYEMLLSALSTGIGSAEPPEGMEVTLEGNEAVLRWTEETPGTGEAGETLYLVTADLGNRYLNYQIPQEDQRELRMVLTPGRTYLAGFAWSDEAPGTYPERYVTFSAAPAEKLTEYGFVSRLCCLAEAPEEGLAPGEAPKPVKRVTEAMLRSGRLWFYSESAYEVTERKEERLLITLTTPEGENYRYLTGWIYAPEYMNSDLWYLSMEETGLLEDLNRNGYPSGTYEIGYYVGGALADAFTFDLE